MDMTHVPHIQDQDDLIGLVLLCVILELSNALHPGSYDDEELMTQLERVLLVEARRHARLIITWLKTFWVVSKESLSSSESVDVFEVLLWQVAMTLSSSIEENKHLKPFLKGCTPDTVACNLYDSLVHRRTSPSWTRRGVIPANSYDWEGGALIIVQKHGATILSEDDSELSLGTNEGDDCAFRGRQPPSFHNKITMDIWLQRKVKRRNRSHGDERSEDSGSGE